MDHRPWGSRCHKVRYGEKSFSGKTRSASTWPESNGSPNTPQPLTYSWCGQGGLPCSSGRSVKRVARSSTLMFLGLVAEGGGAVADPLPELHRPAELGVGDQAGVVELLGVEADWAHQQL